ncbi:hypothetical protein QJS66_04115 [Kocuria rhizophila]|nr:hypothetical protein QJS66_04115 [Kocuria rhizophila]
MIEAGGRARFMARRSSSPRPRGMGVADPPRCSRRGGRRGRAADRRAGGPPSRSPRPWRLATAPSPTPPTSAVDAAIADVRAGVRSRACAPAGLPLPGSGGARPLGDDRYAHDAPVQWPLPASTRRTSSSAGLLPAHALRPQKSWPTGWASCGPWCGAPGAGVERVRSAAHPSPRPLFSVSR